MRTVWAYVLATSIGCGNVKSPNAIDASMSGDAPTEAAHVCDPTARFGAPVPVMGLALTGISEGGPRLSADELTLYFHGGSSGDPNVVLDLYVAHRSALTEPFGMPALLMGVNSTVADFAPSVSTDGLTLWFTSNRVAGAGYHLYLAIRPSTLIEFANPGLAATVNAADMTVSDAHPFVTADGKELWFISRRSPNMGGFDIWHATRAGTDFTMPVMAAELSSPSEEFLPSLSTDRLTVYFASTRPATGGKGGHDIWTSHRTTVDDGFPAPTLVDELNTPGDDFASWLSADNCRIYGSSGNTTSSAIFMATRQP
jgi:hypothetical protein